MENTTNETHTGAQTQPEKRRRGGQRAQTQRAEATQEPVVDTVPGAPEPEEEPATTA